METQSSTPENVALNDKTQEYQVPETNHIDRLERIFELANLVTKQSTTKDGIKRPLLERRARAKITNHVKELDRSDPDDRLQIKEHLDLAKKRDEILTQFLNQGTIDVTLDNLGTQTVRYTDVSLQEADTKSKNTIVMIGGLSYDLGTYQPLIQEVALQGRTVLALGYPESTLTHKQGTQEFIEAIEQSEDFALHAKLYKQILEKLRKEGKVSDTVELWGYSTGAPIIAEMLLDDTVTEHVQNAALICPAGCVDQSPHQLSLGAGAEAAYIATKYLKETPSFPYIDTSGEEGIRDRVKDKLFEWIHKSHDDIFKGARVKDGGKITFFVEENDQVTKAVLAKEEFSENPQAVVVTSGGCHTTPLLNPEPQVKAIFQSQETDLPQGRTHIPSTY